MKNINTMYKIEVINNQTIDGVTNSISEKSKGKYYQRGDKKYIIYESQNDGEKYSTIVIVEDERVNIKRSGFVESNMKCDLKVDTKSLYIMPYGKVVMDIKTNNISSTLKENGGELALNYILKMQEQEYYNNMIIKVIEDIK